MRGFNVQRAAASRSCLELPTKQRSLSQEVIQYVWSLCLPELAELTRYKLAEKFMLNKNYLSEKFKKETRMTISGFIQTVKIKRAEDLLKSRHDMNIVQISRLIGIQKPQQFREKFRRIYGLNPLQYRNVHK